MLEKIGKFVNPDSDPSSRFWRDGVSRLVRLITIGVKTHEASIVLGIGVVLVSLISFATGYLAAREQLKEPIRIEQSYGEQQ